MNAAIIVLTNYYKLNAPPSPEIILSLAGIVSTFVGGTQTVASGFANGVGKIATFSSPRGLCHSGGNIYVPDFTNNLIRQISLTSATATTLAGGAGGTTAGSANGTSGIATFSGPTKAATDGSGNLFICDFTNNMIRQIDLATGVVSTLAGAVTPGYADLTGTNARFNGPAGICYDGSGNLFVVERVSNRVRKIVISTAVVSTLAGSGSAGFASGYGTNAALNQPNGITIQNGILYITEINNNFVRSVDPITGSVSGFAGGSPELTNAAGYAEGIGKYAMFNQPRGSCIDTSGNMFICDFNNNVIRKVILETGIVTRFAGGGGYRTAGSANGVGTSATFNGPSAIVYDSGNLFVVDTTSRLIRQIVIETATVTTFAGSGSTGSTNGTGISASFNAPLGICNDNSGNLYIADTGNSLIRKIVIDTAVVSTLIGVGSGIYGGICYDGSGNLFFTTLQNVRKVIILSMVVTTIAGTSSTGFADGVGTNARFSNPFGIICYSDSLYVADNLNRTLRRIVIATANVTTIAGTRGSAGNADGVGLSAMFNLPAYLTLDYSGNVYVSEYNGNNTIREMNLETAYVTTFVGGGSSITSGKYNGVGPNAFFSQPSDIVADTSGSLFVADSANNLVRKVVAATGATTTLAGGGSLNGILLGSADGVGTTANFNFSGGFPGLTIDTSGNLFIGDPVNNLIRQIAIATGTVTTVAGGGTAGGSTNGVVAGFLNKSGISASFSLPQGIASDSSGKIYVADLTNRQIRMITPAGVVTTLAGGNISATTGYNNSIGISALFNGAESCPDNSGNLYIADSSNNLIRKAVLSSGIVTTVAGGGSVTGVVGGVLDGVGTAALFFLPKSPLYLDGILYVAGIFTAQIRQIDLATGFVTSLPCSATFGLTTDGSGNLYSIVEVSTGTNYVIYQYVIATRDAIDLTTSLGISFNYPTDMTYYNGSLYITESTGYIIREFRLSTSVATILAGSGAAVSIDGIGTNASFFNPVGITSDGSGNLFVSEGTSNRIRKIVIATGLVTTFAGGLGGRANGIGTIARFNTPGAIKCDALGNLYVTDRLNYSIRKIVIRSGLVTTVVGGGDATNVGGNINGLGLSVLFNNPNSIVADNSGNVFVGDGNMVRQVSVNTGIVTTLAGGGNSSASGFNDSIGVSALFNGCQHISHWNGNVYIADSSNNMIRVLNTGTSTVTTLAGRLTAAYVNNTGVLAYFNSPRGVCTDGSGNLFVCDFTNNAVRQIVISTRVVTTLATGLIGPYGICYDGSGNLFVADFTSNRIRKIVISTGLVSVLAGGGTAGSATGVGTNATFNGPRGICYDGSGNLFVAESGSSLIRRIVISSATVSNPIAAIAPITGIVSDMNGYLYAVAATLIYEISLASFTFVIYAGGNAGGGQGLNGIGNSATFATATGCTLDASGNLYVASHAGTLIRMVNTANAQVTTIAGGGFQNAALSGYSTGVGTNAAFSNVRVGAIDNAGNLYVCDTSNNLIKSINISSGTVSLVAGGGKNAGSTNGYGLQALFGNGTNWISYYNNNLFISDSANNQIRQMNLNSGLVTLVAGGLGSITAGFANSAGLFATFTTPQGIVYDNSGNLFVCESGNHLIRKIVIATATVTTLAGQTTSGSADGTGTAATFNGPQGICYDGSANLFVADYGNNRIRQIVIATATVNTLAGSLLGTTGFINGVGTNATFNAPLGICYYSNSLYVSEVTNNLIRQVNVNTGMVTTVAGGVASNTGTGNFVGSGPNGGGINILMTNPMYIACDRLNIYIAPSVNYIIKMNTTTGAGSIIAGKVSSGFADGTGTDATFNSPYPGCVDNLANLYISDSGNYLIRQMNLITGLVTTLAGTQGTSAIINGTGATAAFKAPSYSCYYNGSLFIVDGNAIRQLALANNEVTTLAGGLATGADNGVGTNATFNVPTGICSDGSGNLYVCEFGTYDIRKIVISTGVVTLYAGQSGTFGTANGTGTAARFNSLQGITYYDGFLYVADQVNNGIRRINVLSRVVTTFAGTLGSAGRVNGVGTAAIFNNPRGIQVDNSGNLFVADHANSLIRKINIGTMLVTTISGGGAAIQGPAKGYADGRGYYSLFVNPGSAGADSSGNMFIYDGNLIRKAVFATGFVTTLAGGLGYTTAGFVNGTGTSAAFSGIQGAVCDPSGNLFIADFSNYAIRQLVIATGIVSTLAGTGSSGFANETGTNAAFVGPNAVAYYDGSIYVADGTGRRVRQIVIATGVVTTLAGSGISGSTNAIGTNASFGTLTGIMADGSGNLFVCDNNLIRQIIISTAAVSTLAGGLGGTTAGSADGVGINATFRGVTGGGYYNGSLFIIDTGNSLIRQIVISTAVVTTLPGTFGAGTRGICADGSGNIYVGDSSIGIFRIINLASGSVSRFVGGGGSNALGYADGPAEYALFNSPYGVSTDPSGNIYVADNLNFVVRVISNGIVSTFAGKGIPGLMDGVGTNSKFASATQMAHDASGNIYITDQLNRSIRKITIATRRVQTIAGGSRNTAGSTNNTDDIASQATLFNGPTSCCVDPSGNLFVADRGNNLIRQIVLATGQTTTLAGGLGTTTAGFLNGIGTNATFSAPTDIKYNAGNLYVSDATTNLVRQITISSGNVTTVAGGGVRGVVGGYANGIGINALFTTINGISIDSVADGSGNLYIVDGGNHVIRKMVLATGMVTTFVGGLGFNTAGCQDGIGTNSMLNAPYNVVYDGSGNIFVSDTGNGLIRKIVLATAELTTFVGQAGITSPYKAGTGTNAVFSPGVMTIDTSGNIFVVSNSPPAISQIAISTGVVTLLAGGVSSGSTNGVGTNASFNATTPFGITYSSGNLYIADTLNQLIRELVISTATVTTLAGAGAGINGPSGIIADDSGNLFVFNQNTASVLKITLSNSAVSLFAGGTAGTVDGVGTNARFLAQRGQISYNSGNLYIGDGNTTPAYIRQVNIATALVTTIAGGGSSNASGNSNATGSAATFRSPAGLAVGSNALYVADGSNNVIRMIV